MQPVLQWYEVLFLVVLKVLILLLEPNREEFLRQGGIEPLLRALNSRDSQTVRFAMRAICLLTTDGTV
jgi:hypothetical protein